MMLARAAGFERVIFVDHGRHITGDSACYADFSRWLRDHGYEVPVVSARAGIDDIMRDYAAEYLTDGIRSLTALPDHSVDFSFSQAVLEHVPKAQAGEYLRQLRRVGKPSGISSHHIDLKDHLGGSLNHLRFSEAAWEREALYRSGIYTNRLRYSGWLRLFGDARLDYRIVERKRFPSLPLKRRQLSSGFRHLEEDDLLTMGFQVVFAGDEGALD
jgi:ubiquinone/menaquinone biosynthesis C-methylase UbiE